MFQLKKNKKKKHTKYNSCGELLVFIEETNKKIEHNNYE